MGVVPVFIFISLLYSKIINRLVVRSVGIKYCIITLVLNICLPLIE
jgi:hypothetical protein